MVKAEMEIELEGIIFNKRPNKQKKGDSVFMYILLETPIKARKISQGLKNITT